MDPLKALARHQRDREVCPEIKRVWDENCRVYGVRKAWLSAEAQGLCAGAARTVDRLMEQIGIRGAVRGKVIRTTVPDTSAPGPRDKVNRVFRAPAPNLLWGRPVGAVGSRPMDDDFTCVSTWQGFVYVAPRHGHSKRWRFSIIDTCADRIVGWRVLQSAKTDLVLDALKQARHDRRPVQKGGLIHRSDRGGQSVSVRYTARFAEAGIEPSVGSRRQN